MSRKWKSIRCSMSGQPFTGAPVESGKPPGQQKCPRCRRTFFVNERHKWPTHGVHKMSWGYGE